MGNRNRSKPVRGQQAKKVRSMYLDGLSVRQICDRLGLTRGSVDRCLAAGGVRKRARTDAIRLRAHTRTDEEIERDEMPRQRRRVDIPIDEVISMYLEGMSEKALSERFNVSRTPIFRTLSEAGIRRRSRSEAETLKWSQMSKDRRAARVAAAHRASTGKKKTPQQKIKAAGTRASRWQLHTTSDAVSLMEQLATAGISCEAERAVGPYNIDVAVAGTIAVELHGGGWHMSKLHRAREPERIKHLLDEGWQCLTIWIDKRRHPISAGCVKYIVAMLEELRRDHPPSRQNRVIRGNGKPWPERRIDVD